MTRTEDLPVLVVGAGPTGLTAAVARMGLNVLEVEHHRAGLRLGVDEVEVLLTLETRDPEHRHDIVAGLQANGFRVELVR